MTDDIQVPGSHSADCHRDRCSLDIHWSVWAHINPEPTLEEQATATLKRLGLRPVCPGEGAAHLNARRIHDPQGNPWTPATLAAYLDEHDIRPEVVPDLSHFAFVVPDREWNRRSILRAIERSPDATEDKLRQAIVDDPAVRREVIHLWSTVNDSPWPPGIYREWLEFARQHEGTP